MTHSIYDPLPPKLKVGFLGGAVHSAVGRTHCAAIDIDARFELVAGCFSRRPEVNAHSAQSYGVDADRVHRGLTELLEAERDRIDALILLTPTDQHFEQIQQCRRAGMPVICEKAMVATLDEARTIKSDFDGKKEFLAVTFNYTGYPMVRELKAAIESGEFGEITQIRAEMPQEGFAKVDQHGKPIAPQDWRLHDGPIPTISLDLGVHLHVLVRFLTGARPESVVAAAGTKGNFPPVIDSVSCLVRYSNGMDGSIWFSKTALGHRNGLKIEIYGTRKSAIWVQEHPEQALYGDRYGNRIIVDRASPAIRVASENRYSRFKAGHPAGFIEAFANYYGDIADALAHFQTTRSFDHDEFVFGPEVAVEGVYWLDAVARSAHTQSWVQVNRG